MDETSEPLSLDEIVESYESTIVETGDAQVEQFLPDRRHPRFREILSELLRVDLEHCWNLGRRESLEHYCERFPDAFADSQYMAALAFEEFRLRRHSGEAVSRDEYARRYQIDVTNWPADLRPMEREGFEPTAPVHGDSFPATVDPTQSPVGIAASAVPSRVDATPGDESSPEEVDASQLHPGERFLGFEIVSELGRGAAARVYLARQRALANRYVVLKVTSEPTVEADRLARLQHTNIVPIYSVHQVGQLHVLCMPFLGSCVLNQWVDHLRRREGVPVTRDEFLTTFNLMTDATLSEPPYAPTRALPVRENEADERPPLVAASATGMHRLRGADYQETILWLTARLADGLAHAHDHGILHLDIKPANILLTDDGQPMLLDFHLATATSPRSPAATAVGGTLPYMSPEQLNSLEFGAQVDVRSDIYSLGVVLFELLTGQLPFPRRTGALADVLVEMHADRRRAPPRLRPLNPMVTPAVESLVRRCLFYHSGQRYQSADELSEDIHRQLRNLPLLYASNPSLRERLTKWARRHPRATSGGAVLVASACVVAAMGGLWSLREQRLAHLEVDRQFAAFADQAPLVKSALSLPTTEPHELQSEMERAWGMLKAAGMTERPEVGHPAEPGPLLSVARATSIIGEWRRKRQYQFLTPSEQRQLDRTVGELLFLLAAAEERPQASSDGATPTQRIERALACNRLAVACFPEGRIPVAVWLQQAGFLDRLGRTTEAQEARSLAARASPESATDNNLSALRLVTESCYREALELLKELREEEPRDPALWYLSGESQLALHDFARAEASFTACIALRPDWHLAWYERGVCRLQSRQFEEARSDFTHVLALEPRNSAALVSRALAWEGEGMLREAVRDLTQAVDAGFQETRLYLLRARIHERLGATEEAADDRAEGLRRTPTDARSWVARGMVRLGSDPEEALRDFRSAVALNPHEYEAYRSLAHVLSERLNRPKEAIAALDDVLKLTASDPLAWAGRGVLLAREGNQTAALEDSRRALTVRREPLVVYQAACIEALGSTQSPEGKARALALLGEALRGDPALASIAPIDPDLAAVHGMAEFEKLVAAAQVLNAAGAKVTK